MDDYGLFGHVNDTIRNLALEASDSERWEFFCECPDLQCHKLVVLTLTEFDQRRAAMPPTPILSTHDNA
jgi:hypothetical protein